MFNFTCQDCQHLAPNSSKRKVLVVKTFDDGPPSIREYQYGHKCGPQEDLKLIEHSDYQKETKRYGSIRTRLFQRRKILDPFGGLPVTLYLEVDNEDS